jgi:hypothetical protein
MVREVLFSTVFCITSAAPLFTRYWTGSLMRSVLPILAPDCANESSYSRHVFDCAR